MIPKRVKLDPVRLLQWLDRYGPLCQYLDEAKGHTGRIGFGVFQITMHGKRPMKAGPVGEMKELPQQDFIVDMGELLNILKGQRVDSG